MFKQITISIMALGLLSLPAFAQSSGFDINAALPNGGYAPLPNGGYAPLPNGGYAPLPNGGYAPLPTSGYPSLPASGYAALPTSGYAPLPTSGYPSLPTSGYAPLPTSGYAPLPTSGYPSLPTSGYAPLPTGSWANVITPVVQTAVQAVTQGQAANYMSVPANITGQGVGIPAGLPYTSTSGVAINTVSCPNCRDSGYVDPTFTGAASPTGAGSVLGSAFPGGNLTNSLINAGASSLMNSILPSNGAPSSIAQQSYAANTAAFNNMNQLTAGQVQSAATSPPIPQYSPANNVAAPAPAAPVDPTAPTFSTQSYFDSNGN